MMFRRALGRWRVDSANLTTIAAYISCSDDFPTSVSNDSGIGEWSIPRNGYMSNLFKLIRKETNVVIWMAGIIRGKATMDRFEWLAGVERSDKIKFGPTNDKEYDW